MSRFLRMPAVSAAMPRVAGVPPTNQLTSVSVVLPVMDETFSLQQTVDIIIASADEYVSEFIMVVCERTERAALETVDALRRQLGSRAIVHNQRLPFLGGALREAFEIASASHVVLMASDLETDPRLLRSMIEAEAEDPNGVVTMTRWSPGGGFRGYSRPKLILNWLFQQVFTLMYGTKLTDMTYAYRIMPTNLVKSIRWEELRHPFLLETMVKPLRLGVRITELPAVWKVRPEGVTHNPFLQNFVYFRTGIRARFASRASLLRGPDELSAIDRDPPEMRRPTGSAKPR